MPAGVSSAGLGRSRNRSAAWMRRSISRHARQVFVELLLVAVAQLALQGPGIVQDEVEDRPLLLLAEPQVPGALVRRAGAEEPLEGEAGVGLGCQRQ